MVGIVEQHQGSIWVYSEPGKGTTFKIYLPQTEDAVDEDAVPTRELPLLGTERVLVVEDDDLVRTLVCETLEADGYTVVERRSPADALVAVDDRTADFDLLLTDVVMPGMNGRELFEKIEAKQPDISVVFMSGYTDNVIVHHGVLDSSVMLLQKPFSIRRLREAVRAGIARTQERQGESQSDRTE